MHKPLFLTEQSSEIEKRKLFSPIERSSETKSLVVQLTTLLENWDESPTVSITQLREDPTPDEKEDLIRILAININSTNTINYNQFTNSTQFDVEEPKTYLKVMQGPHVAE